MGRAPESVYRSRTMRSVADEMRREARRRLSGLSPRQRLELSERLAADDLDLFRRVHGLSLEEARSRLDARREAGRRPSAVAGPTT